MMLQTKTVIPPFSAQQLDAIAKVLGDTDDGLSGSEIGHMLADCRIDDPSQGITKWKRLFNAFVAFQNRNNAGNHVLVFIRRAMNPASYTERPSLFALRRNQLNTIIAFAGYELNDKGEIIRANAAATLTEAMQRVNKFHAALKLRDVHPVIYEFCTAEILAEKYFHAVFEAMKSIASKIRAVTGLSSDGAELVQAAFQLGRSNTPLFAVNRLSTETERGEQRGFVNLLVGLYGTVRNPLAHDPKIEWDMTEQNALDIMSRLSLVHRKLDRARRYEPH